MIKLKLICFKVTQNKVLYNELRNVTKEIQSNAITVQKQTNLKSKQVIWLINLHIIRPEKL